MILNSINSTNQLIILHNKQHMFQTPGYKYLHLQVSKNKGLQINLITEQLR